MSETQDIAQMSPEVNQRIANAPSPAKATLRARQNPFLQLFEFAGFNLRILRLVTIAKFGKHPE